MIMCPCLLPFMSQFRIIANNWDFMHSWPISIVFFKREVIGSKNLYVPTNKYLNYKIDKAILT